MTGVTIGERSTEIIVRFDQPISHERSSITLFLDGEIVELLLPSLAIAPNILFARIATPARGHYVVRWNVWAQGGNGAYHGQLCFEVGHTASANDDERHSSGPAE